MEIVQGIKRLIRRPLTEEELAARAEVEAMRERARREAAQIAVRRKRRA